MKNNKENQYIYTTHILFDKVGRRMSLLQIVYILHN